MNYLVFMQIGLSTMQGIISNLELTTYNKELINRVLTDRRSAVDYYTSQVKDTGKATLLADYLTSLQDSEIEAFVLTAKYLTTKENNKQGTADITEDSLDFILLQFLGTCKLTDDQLTYLKLLGSIEDQTRSYPETGMVVLRWYLYLDTNNKDSYLIAKTAYHTTCALRLIGDDEDFITQTNFYLNIDGSYKNTRMFNGLCSPGSIKRGKLYFNTASIGQPVDFPIQSITFNSITFNDLPSILANQFNSAQEGL